MMIVTLIGYRGSGKTSVGRELSRRLGWPCIDADDVVEERGGCSIREMFEQRGERFFRDLEEEVVADILKGESKIVSPGGGAILRETTRRRIQEAGPVIWLQGSVEVLGRRLEGDGGSGDRRPGLTSKGMLDEIRDVLTRREPLYRSMATLVLSTDQKSVEQLADEILRELQLQKVG